MELVWPGAKSIQKFARRYNLTRTHIHLWSFGTEPKRHVPAPPGVRELFFRIPLHQTGAADWVIVNSVTQADYLNAGPCSRTLWQSRSLEQCQAGIPVNNGRAAAAAVLPCAVSTAGAVSGLSAKSGQERMAAPQICQVLFPDVAQLGLIRQ